jgi:hypothetical protein
MLNSDVGQLLVVCAAPGTGKSALLPELVEAARPMVVVDLDELPDDGRILGVPVSGPAGELNWAAYEALWFKILDFITRAGHTALILSQIPALDRSLPTHTPPGTPITWYLLDCPDEVRSGRLKGRGWSDDRIAEATQAAESARGAIPARIMVGPDEELAQIAQRVLHTMTNPAR